MIEMRWVILLAVWTLLIGPVVDMAQHVPTAPHGTAKSPFTSKRVAASER